MTHRSNVVLGYQLLASQGLAPLSAPAVASGSSTVEPTREPVSAHWSSAGFQPLVSARIPTTRLPPLCGVAALVDVEVVAALLDELLPQAAAASATTMIMAMNVSVGRTPDRDGTIWSGLMVAPMSTEMSQPGSARRQES